MPSLVDVAANAIMSGTGVAEAERSSRVKSRIDRRREGISTVETHLCVSRGKSLGRSKGQQKTLGRPELEY